MPEHIDCGHNVLLNTGPGSRTLRVLDLLTELRACAAQSAPPERVTCVQRLLKPGALARAASGSRLLEVEIQPYDALLIPPAWLHDSTYAAASSGINQFFTNPEDPATLRCRDLKSLGRQFALWRSKESDRLGGPPTAADEATQWSYLAEAAVQTTRLEGAKGGCVNGAAACKWKAHFRRSADDGGRPWKWPRRGDVDEACL